MKTAQDYTVREIGIPNLQLLFSVPLVLSLLLLKEALSDLLY